MHFYSKNAFSKKIYFLTLWNFTYLKDTSFGKKLCNFELGLETKNEFEKWPLYNFVSVYNLKKKQKKKNKKKKKKKKKLGFVGIYLIFLSFAPKHRLWVLVRTALVYVFIKNIKNIEFFQ